MIQQNVKCIYSDPDKYTAVFDAHVNSGYIRVILEHVEGHFEVGKHYVLTIEPETFDPPPFKGETPLAHHLVM